MITNVSHVKVDNNPYGILTWDLMNPKLGAEVDEVNTFDGCGCWAVLPKEKVFSEL